MCVGGSLARSTRSVAIFLVVVAYMQITTFLLLITVMTVILVNKLPYKIESNSMCPCKINYDFQVDNVFFRIFNAIINDPNMKNFIITQKLATS